MASEASRITYEVFGEIRAGGSSHARPRAYFLVSTAILHRWVDSPRVEAPISVERDLVTLNTVAVVCRLLGFISPTFSCFVFVSGITVLRKSIVGLFSKFRADKTVDNSTEIYVM